MTICPRCRLIQKDDDFCVLCAANLHVELGEGDALTVKYASPFDLGIEGVVLASEGALPRCWELREKGGEPLVRGVRPGAFSMQTDEDVVQLEGPLWLEELGEAQRVDSYETRLRLILPPDIALPERLYLAERTLLAGDVISVRGEVKTAAAAGSYRDVTFGRRLVGSPGQPLLVREAKMR